MSNHSDGTPMQAIDASAMHAALRAEVDGEFLPGVSTALIRRGQVVDRFCYGWADREARVPLRHDHIHRVFSNTKLVTSCAVMLLVDDGVLGLDEPVGRWVPELANPRVLRPGATGADDTEAAARPITLRHLMTHTSGLSYGLFDPASALFDAYVAARVLHREHTLAEMMKALAPLPLSFHPGERWEYSVASDVLARVVEVAAGQPFGRFIAQRIFEPLAMVDTDFWVPPAKQDRLCALYRGVDLADATRPGLVRMDREPYTDAYLSKSPRESGGGGLVSTLDDMTRLVQSLLPGGQPLLRPESLTVMFSNQLREGLCVAFPDMPRFPGRSFGLGSAVTVGPVPSDPTEAIGEASWGGMAGTTWWLHPRLQIAGVLMTQRWLGSSNRYAAQFRQNAYRALTQG